MSDKSNGNNRYDRYRNHGGNGFDPHRKRHDKYGMYGPARPSGRYGGPGRRVPWPVKVLGALVFIPGMLLLFSWLLMLLWNALLPAIFGITVISFWQAMGILILSRFLFGGRPGGRFGGRPRFPRRPRFDNREEWREHLKRRFAEEHFGNDADSEDADNGSNED